MSEKIEKGLQDIASERAVLAGICQYGIESYLDVADILNDKTFTVDYNVHIFTCLKNLFESDVKSVDVASLLSKGSELGLTNVLSSKGCSSHILGLFSFPINQDNVRRLAAKIRKLEVARLLRKQLGEVQDNILGISGNETLTEILGLAENAIFDFSSLLHDGDEAPQLLGDGLVDYIQHLIDNPVDQIGIPTGFPEYDKAIGGGLRKGTINVIGARSKAGKSLLGGGMGFHIASKLNIPILNLDTEMSKEDHIHRTLAMETDCYIFDIETGKFGQKPGFVNKIKEAARKIEKDKVPYYHKSIAGMPFEEQLAVMRRWLVKEVGLDNHGKAKECVVVYDYLKLMSADGLSSSLQEFQMLGFMMTGLHNFAVRYKIPILLFIQLNRDGIVKEGADTASGSDRVIWLCSNYTIFKFKSDEEIAQDGPQNGNRKLVPVLARHGAGIDSGDYINCFAKTSCAKIIEGKRKFQLGELNEKNEIEDPSETDF